MLATYWRHIFSKKKIFLDLENLFIPIFLNQIGAIIGTEQFPAHTYCSVRLRYCCSVLQLSIAAHLCRNNTSIILITPDIVLHLLWCIWWYTFTSNMVICLVFFFIYISSINARSLSFVICSDLFAWADQQRVWRSGQDPSAVTHWQEADVCHGRALDQDQAGQGTYNSLTP